MEMEIKTQKLQFFDQNMLLKMEIELQTEKSSKKEAILWMENERKWW